MTARVEFSSPGGGGAERSEVGHSAAAECPEGARLRSRWSVTRGVQARPISRCTIEPGASPPSPAFGGYFPLRGNGFVAIIGAVSLAAAALTGCGVKDEPSRPSGKKSPAYTYPRQDTAPGSVPQQTPTQPAPAPTVTLPPSVLR
jgi:hypothetical protein